MLCPKKLLTVQLCPTPAIYYVMQCPTTLTCAMLCPKKLLTVQLCPTPAIYYVMQCPTTLTCAMLCPTTTTYCAILCTTAQQHSNAIQAQYLNVFLSFPSVAVSHSRWILTKSPLYRASLSVREVFKTLIILSVCRFTSLLIHHQTDFPLHSQYETTGPLFQWTCPVALPRRHVAEEGHLERSTSAQHAFDDDHHIVWNEVKILNIKT